MAFSDRGFEGIEAVKDITTEAIDKGVIVKGFESISRRLLRHSEKR